MELCLSMQFQRPKCIQCGTNVVELTRQLGKFRDKCTTCRRGYSRSSSRHYTKFKKDICERCGFIPEHPCQLDVDHKAGNKLKSFEQDLETLCANCHRLKTYLNRDSVNVSRRVEQ